MPAPATTFLIDQRERHEMGSVTIEEATLSHLSRLPAIHRDPFDRILVAQALQHKLTLVTVDPLVKAYPVPVLAE